MAEATDEQQDTTSHETENPIRATANILARIETVTILEKAALTYADWKSAEASRLGNLINKEDIFAQTVTALSDLQLAKNNPELIQKFRNDWGEQSPAFERLLEDRKSDIEKAQNQSLGRAEKMKDFERAIVGLRAAYTIAKYSSEEQQDEIERLFAGSKQTAKNVLISAGLATATTVGIVGLMTAGEALGFAHPTLPDIPNSNALTALAFSYVLEYAATLVNGKINANALKDAKVGTSANIYATLAYYYLRRVVPNNEKIQDAGVILGTLIPVLSGEPTTLPLLLLPNGGNAVFNKNIISALGQLATAAALKYYQIRQQKRSISEVRNTE